MAFTLFYKNDRLETKIFSWKGEKLPNDSDIKAKSRVKFIAVLFSLTRGTFGLTMKPKLRRIVSKTQENEFETYLLKDDIENGLSNIDQGASPLELPHRLGLSRRLSDIEYEKPVVLNLDLGYDENDYESPV